MKSIVVINFEFEQSADLHSFLNATICLRKAQLLECLDNYNREIGNAINEYLYCYFAKELEPDDFEYFGSSGVAVFALDACAGCLNVTVLTKDQFFRTLFEALHNHRQNFSDDEWAMIQNKLHQLLSVG